MKLNKKRLAVVLALTTATGIVITAAALAAASPNATVSVLERPAVATDRLPVPLMNSNLMNHLANSEDVRLALAKAGTDVFLARGRDATLCIVAVNEQFVASCAGSDLLQTGGIYMTTPQSDGTMDVYVAVADGFNQASAGSVQAPVTNNVVWLHGVPLTTTSLRLTGSAGTRIIDLGLQVPPSS